MRSEQSFAEKLKQRQAQQRRADAAREAETDAEFRARVLREMTDPVGHAAGAGLNAAQAKRRPPPKGFMADDEESSKEEKAAAVEPPAAAEPPPAPKKVELPLRDYTMRLLRDGGVVD